MRAPRLRNLPGRFFLSLSFDIFTAYIGIRMSKRSKTTLFDEIEARLSLGPTHVACLLGLPYISYAQYRNGTRELKLFHVRHMELILLMNDEQIANIKRRYNNGVE
jgi:hypothetical protein